ncbi:class I SAM-dependent methyltransferase [Aliarcobacter cryaerophilus]|uniref:class I SAM-dependent methyltransferase n=1 Tax=Aliarcobacter cryaerophilus TaxID=28198 RepID=UPI0011E006B8|nr:class I SAM-dependent methyltransferase [Aliarcobacter cryaerophilus]
MKVQKFWQTDWFGIEFSSFAKLNPKKQADEVFYEKFYTEFFKKFNSYEDLPEQYKKDKNLLVDFILEKIKDCNKGLAIGCGNGYIENELTKKWGGELIAVEPSKVASKWISKNIKINFVNGYFPDTIKSDENFDFAYMCYVDYVFDNKSYITLLKNVKNYPINDFLLVGVSTYSPNLIQTIKYNIKKLLSIFGFFNQQLWGYLRTIDEHKNILKEAGYKNIDFGQLKNGVFWIRAKND